jgi:hypothetical protein
MSPLHHTLVQFRYAKGGAPFARSRKPREAIGATFFAADAATEEDRRADILFSCSAAANGSSRFF